MNEHISELERNPITKEIHRKQVIWQITLPLILGILGVLALGVCTILAVTGGRSVSQTADASLIFLLIPTMIMAIVPLILFAGLAYGFYWLNKNLPAAMYKVQQMMTSIRDVTRTGADKMVEPVLRFSSTVASLQVLKRKKIKLEKSGN